MNSILITYFSESGSTAEIAQTIADTSNFEKVDVCHISEVKHLNYDAIIIGSPNWYGNLSPAVVQFIKEHEDKIAKMPLAIFFSCMDCYPNSAPSEIPLQIFCDSHFKHQTIKGKASSSSWEKSHAVSTYLNNLNKVSNKLNLKSIAFFKGRLNFKKISFTNAMVMRFICLINKKVKPGNYINPQDVAEWSKSLKF